VIGVVGDKIGDACARKVSQCQQKSFPRESTDNYDTMMLFQINERLLLEFVGGNEQQDINCTRWNKHANLLGVAAATAAHAALVASDDDRQLDSR
jgi:hypothetical protein